MARRLNDFYPTPAWATEILLEHVAITGNVLEPCAGQGHISHVLDRHVPDFGQIHVYTNDIDPVFDCDGHADALDLTFWNPSRFGGEITWVVSNPPFSIADQLVPLAYEKSYFGIAMLLRLSWLEPTRARGPFLEEHPPTTVIVLPRISFDGSGQTDNVTTAWFVWDRRQCNGQRLIVVPRRAPQVRLLDAPMHAVQGALPSTQAYAHLGGEG